MRVVVFLALALAIPVRPERGAAPVPPPPAAAATIQGTWQHVEYYTAGKAMPKTAIDNMSLIIEGDELRLANKNVSTATPYAFVYDPSKTPAILDFTPKKNTKIGFKGIIKIEGDVMTMCFTRDGLERPTHFERNDRVGAFYWQLRRVSK